MFYWVFSCKNSILYHPSYKKRVKKSWIIINHKDSTVYPNVVYEDGLNWEFSGSVLRLGFRVRANPKHHYNILASDAKKMLLIHSKNKYQNKHLFGRRSKGCNPLNCQQKVTNPVFIIIRFSDVVFEKKELGTILILFHSS